ncbi:MAG: cofactor-independent phosphoglycerate mutase [Desulfobacteraceae bacterium]|nr:cofactor-independent phosphoglycerate mutase [Desulfobacteraceae bacterium]
MKEKFVILVGDGMGDYPLDELGGRTPLEAAETPNLDQLVRTGRMGTVQTIPAGMPPGSDVANMSLLGYDPAVYHTGRGPLEAASMNVRLAPDEIAFRCNLVNLGRAADGSVVMGDYSAGHITTEEAHGLIAALQETVSGTSLMLYPGVSYRHLLVWKGGKDGLRTTPPHDIIGQATEPYYFLSEVPELQSFVDAAAEVLRDHPINRSRTAAGKLPANAVWPWGQGRAPSMPRLQETYGISGVMISAVDLLKGIGVYAGLVAVDVPGATGYLDTNYEGKVAAAIAALASGDFVFLHLEAPDEASHEGSLEKKLKAIANFDARIIGPVLRGLDKYPDWRVLVVTDHYTPIAKRTHSSNPVPFLLAGSGSGQVSGTGSKYCEREALEKEWRLNSGEELFRTFMGKQAMPGCCKRND